MCKRFIYITFLFLLVLSCKQEIKSPDYTTRESKVGIKIIPDTLEVISTYHPFTKDMVRKVKAGKAEVRPYSLEAEDGIPHITSLGQGDGLPTYRGFPFQDSTGNLWVVGWDHLVKFDGNDFSKIRSDGFSREFPEYTSGNMILNRRFSIESFDGRAFTVLHEQDTLNGKERTNIQDLEADQNGNLYLSDLYGLKKLEALSGIDSFRVKNVSNSSIWSFSFDMKDGNLWARSTDSLLIFNNDTLLESHPQISRFTDILHTTENEVWLQIPRGFLQKFTSFPLQKIGSSHFITKSSIRASLIDNNNFIWLGSTGKGVFRFSEPDVFNLSREDGLSSDAIHTINEDLDGNIWIGSNSHIDRLDPTFLKYGSIFPDATSSGIRSHFQDIEGRYWFGSFNDGLNLYDGHNLIHYTKSIGLGDGNIGTILQDRSGDIWTSGFNGTITKFDGEFFTVYDISSISRFLYKFIVDYEGKIVSTFRKADDFRRVNKSGVIKINIDGYELLEFNRRNGKENLTVAEEILANKNNEFWISTREGLIFYKDSFALHFDRSNGLPEGRFTLETDHFGNLWIGAREGLVRYDGQSFITYTTKDGLSENQIGNILWDSIHQVLWLGSEAGLTAVIQTANHPDSISFENYDSRHGFPIEKSIFQNLLVDKDGMIWVSYGDDELMRFDYGKLKRTRKPFNLHLKSVGLNNEKVCWNALPSSPSIDSAYDRSALEVEMLMTFGEELSEGQIEDFAVRFAEVAFDSFTIFDPIPMNLVLPYEHNTISFEFAAIDPHYSKFTEYQFKLEGLSQSWSDLSRDNNANYNNLKEGKYTFHIKALNPYGLWSELSYSFQVLPPWYRTVTAYLGYFLLLLLGGWRVHIYQRERIRKIEREKAREKELAQAKEIEKAYTELKTTQSQLIHSEKMASLGELTAGIAHEIQNPLNFVNNFSDVNSELIEELLEEMKKGNYEEAEEIARDIYSNEEKIIHHGKRADAIVKSMLQHSRTNSGEKVETDINALVNEYLNLAYHGMRAKDNSFNAILETNYNENLPKVYIVPQDIGRVLLNLINNAFQATQERKILETDFQPKVSISTHLVSAKSEENDSSGAGNEEAIKRITISIADNGSGIPKEALDKIFQPFFTTKPTGQGTGLGLSMSYDIIKAHGGEIQVETKEGNGTTFIIRLPVDK